jgi:hypothetical protein
MGKEVEVPKASTLSFCQATPPSFNRPNAYGL